LGRRGEHSKEEIVAMALDAAVALLEEEGPERLTTRAVAQRIGYTAGSLYFVFRNRDDLVLQVNMRTLDELRDSLERALSDGAEPNGGLLALGRCYLDFAERHPTRWRLVFEHNLPDQASLPSSLEDRIDALFELICTALAARSPSLGRQALRLAAQSLWGGVHGVAVLSITGKLGAGGDRPAQHLVDDLIGTYLAGLDRRA
jgi:AcrR family transcriptional regulator